MNDRKIDVYVTQATDRPVADDGFKATAILIADGRPQRIVLVPASANKLTGNAPVALPKGPKGGIQILTSTGTSPQAQISVTNEDKHFGGKAEVLGHPRTANAAARGTTPERTKAMKKLILAALLAANTSSIAMAQTANEHEGHHPGGAVAQAAPAQAPASQAPAAGGQKPMMGQMMQGMGGDQMKQMGEMMGMMQKMMPMMEGMQKPDMPPAARAEMMKQMAPMMQQMMPIMQQMMGGMNAGAASPAAANMPPHARSNMEAMDKMHGPMSKAAAVANPDEAFVRGMIPHHQGAIDMAKIVLQYGKDDQVRKWANDVIREQQREIGEMEAWLKKNTR